MASILREVCRERLNQEWAQADKSLDNYKNVMSKESKLIDEGEIRKNILDKAANKILALPFPELPSKMDKYSRNICMSRKHFSDMHNITDKANG